MEDVSYIDCHSAAKQSTLSDEYAAAAVSASYDGVSAVIVKYNGLHMLKCYDMYSEKWCRNLVYGAGLI